ncbi:hypothetical protein EK904_011905 [Melospiza melodia maxima]|nr:hypothetical protein EK904_011905 [Melospiza melodia maxima]
MQRIWGGGEQQQKQIAAAALYHFPFSPPEKSKVDFARRTSSTPGSFFKEAQTSGVEQSNLSTKLDFDPLEEEKQQWQVTSRYCHKKSEGRNTRRGEQLDQHSCCCRRPIAVKIMVRSAFSFKVTKIYLMQKIGREKKIPSFRNIISEKEVQEQRSSIFVIFLPICSLPPILKALQDYKVFHNSTVVGLTVFAYILVVHLLFALEDFLKIMYQIVCCFYNVMAL